MEFTEVIENLKTFEGTEEFENYISGQMTADRINKYLDTDEGKKYVEPIASKRFDKGLETWKANHLNALIDAEVKKRFPDVTPEQKEIAELKAKIEASEAKALRNELTAFAIRTATEKQLPTDLMHFFIGSDETTTSDNISKFETAFNSAVEKTVKERLGGSHKPDAGNVETNFTIDDLDKMSKEEINKYFMKILGKK